MTPERWQQIKDVLQAVLERPSAERSSYIAQLCGRDEALKRDVESFLATYPEAAEADDVIERGAVGLPRELLADAAAASLWVTEPPAAAASGRRIGAYRIVREIGRGGMGFVYLAVRADEAFTRRVAIKIIGYGASGNIGRRFGSERQILADLDHPNIARLLDGGTTDDGVPYFVMEYIEGQSITEYCEARALTIVDRLRLFREVCGAVHYAHRQHIVHRDIKPGNILVTAAGVPKLLDFGIAKIVDPLQDDPTHGSTLRLMTPDYASPEQVLSEPITIASDIYSLGVLLYELLTGRRPYRIESNGSAMTTLAKAICEQEPERPSTAIDGGTKVRSAATGRAGQGGLPLAAELDKIVLMALRKEPSRRYASVEAFSDDIGRYLDGLPVSARKDTAIYRTRRFVRRHPAGATGAMLGTAALIAGALVVSGAVDARRATAAVRGVPSAPRAMRFAQRDWLAIADFENRTGDGVFDSSLNTALAVSLEQSRYVNVFPRRSIEASLRRMKKPEQTPIDAHVAEEIAEREGLRLVLAPAISELGGKYLLSAALLDPSTGARLKSESTRADGKAEILDALDTLGRKVREDLGEVETMIAGASKPLSQVTTSSLDALKLFSLGQERARAARFEDAKALYERALERDPKFVAARAALGMVEFELFDRERGKAIAASLQENLDGLTEREQYNEKAFYATIVENDLPKAERMWKAMLALYPDASNAHNNLGRVYLLMKRGEDAEASFKEAIRVDAYMMPSYVNLANIYLDRGDSDAALAVCQKLVTYDDGNAWAYGLLGRSFLGAGRPVEAATAFERGLAIRTFPQLLHGLGTAYRVLGRPSEALRAFARTLDVDGSDGSAMYEAGVVSQLLSDDRAARGYFDRFRRTAERRTANEPRNAGPYFDLAATWTRLGDPRRGWALAEKAAALTPSDHFDMARVLSLQDRRAEALDALELAVHAGFRDAVRLRTDADLAALADEPRFQQLLKWPQRKGPPL